MLANILELNSKGLYQSLGKEKESCCLVFSTSTKCEIRHFHVVVMQRRQRNVQKSVMHVQSCCFANLNLLRYCRSLWRRRRCLSSLFSHFNWIMFTWLVGRPCHMLPHLSGIPHLHVNRPLVLRVTNVNFLQTISVHYEAKKVIRISKCLLITLGRLPWFFNNNFLH